MEKEFNRDPVASIVHDFAELHFLYGRLFFRSVKAEQVSFKAMGGIMKFE